jgi:hypothetical protein
MPEIPRFKHMTQNRIAATALSYMDAELAALEQGMMQELLTGRIRLV